MYSVDDLRTQNHENSMRSTWTKHCSHGRTESTERVSSSDAHAPTGGPKSPHGNAAAGRRGRRTVGGFDSPGSEELGGLRDGEREKRRDERVVHQARCRGGRLHLRAPLPLFSSNRPTEYSPCP